MKISALKNLITSTVGRTTLKVQAASPEILVVAGVAGMIGTAVLVWRAAHNDEALFGHHLQVLNDIKDGPGQDYKEGRIDIKEYSDVAIPAVGRFGLDLLKSYGPAIALGTVSISCILGGHGILKRRNAALAAAYAIVDEGYKKYRARVSAEYGADKDMEFASGGTRETVTLHDADGGSSATSGIVGAGQFSQYARCFDQTTPSWEPNSEYNLVFLRAQQAYANNMLQARGHIFLNEVYDMLGFERTKAGSVVGWVISKDGDNFVDFGIYNDNYQGSHDFVNGYEKAIWLDFKVEGPIWDMI